MARWGTKQLTRTFLSALLVTTLGLSTGRAELAPEEEPIAENVSPTPPTNSNPPVKSGGGLAVQGGGGSRSLGASGWIARGRSRLSLGAGWGSADNGSYVLLTAGLGYFLMKGLEAGLDGEAWLGN